MKKANQMKNDGKEFERFDKFLTELISAPKDEILRREKEEKERRKKAKKS